MFRILYFLLVLITINACSSTFTSIQNSDSSAQTNNNSLVLVNSQLAIPQSIKSVQLYRKSNKQNPPIITLGKNEKLVLEFDELTSISGQFKITFEHFDKDWNPSNIPDSWFIEGFNEHIITFGTDNALSKPNYFHYKTEFPTTDNKFISSGNYLLHVFDYASNRKLFSLPFFITEQAGSITSRTETVYNAGSSGEAIDQLYSVYSYPEEIEFPQFDLSFSFVQNRFWAHSKSTNSFNLTDNKAIRFYTPRSNSFTSSFDFMDLDLTYLGINLDKIEDWHPEKIPPKIVLKRDILNFSANPSTSYRSNFGIPIGARDARYAEVEFNFVAGNLNIQEANLYVAGDFNHWSFSDDSKLRYNSELGVWQTNLLMKQGNYRYKYFLKSDNFGEAQTFPLNDSITKAKQEYITFVYYKDPTRNFQRLLMVDVR